MSFQFRNFRSAAALFAAAGLLAAQSASAAPTAQASASAASAASSSPAAKSPSYHSPFDGYRKFADQPIVSWREANDLVGRIGGWQAYARENQMAAPAGASAPASSAGGHSGHHAP